MFATGGLPVGNTSGRLAGVGETPGIDLRGDGGYVVAAPSRHITGGTYRWLPGPDAPAPLPSWIAAAAPTRTAAPPLAASVGAGYGDQAIEGEANRLRIAPEGVRNDTRPVGNIGPASPAKRLPLVLHGSSGAARSAGPVGL